MPLILMPVPSAVISDLTSLFSSVLSRADFPTLMILPRNGRIAWNIARVPGLSGINNHEGSRFTQDAASLAPVMRALAARHLFFFDSRTGPQSKVAIVAEAAGVMTAGRDIFLDDDASPAAVAAQLEALERQAKRGGVAIAIGHPHDVTLRMLAAWLGRDHGVTLVPLADAMRLKQARATAFASR